jgi:hypothetical protein
VDVNTGWSLRAGVLRTNKPLSDIIGNPRNITVRLQSLDLLEFVQNNQAAHDKVAIGIHTIEPRAQSNQIELKGK